MARLTIKVIIVKTSLLHLLVFQVAPVDFNTRQVASLVFVQGATVTTAEQRLSITFGASIKRICYGHGLFQLNTGQLVLMLHCINVDSASQLTAVLIDRAEHTSVTTRIITTCHLFLQLAHILFILGGGDLVLSLCSYIL